MLWTQYWWNPETRERSCHLSLGEAIFAPPRTFAGPPFGLRTQVWDSSGPRGIISIDNIQIDHAEVDSLSGPFVAEELSSFIAPSNCRSNPPIRGYLAFFADRREEITLDPSVALAGNGPFHQEHSYNSGVGNTGHIRTGLSSSYLILSLPLYQAL